MQGISPSDDPKKPSETNQPAKPPEIPVKDPPLPPPEIRGVAKPWRKPVILLYNYEPNSTLTVSLRLQSPTDRFLSVYPLPDSPSKSQVLWRVVFEGTDRLRLCNSNKTYPYLFWESFSSSALFSLKSFLCLRSDEVEDKLDDILAIKGLNYKERCDMITYWLAELKASDYVKIGFLDEKLCNERFPLEVLPAPASVIRVFMVFESVGQQESSTVQGFESSQGRERIGPTVVEWGGLNISGNNC